MFNFMPKPVISLKKDKTLPSRITLERLYGTDT